jgi:hypothetical protein
LLAYSDRLVEVGEINQKPVAGRLFNLFDVFKIDDGWSVNTIKLFGGKNRFPGRYKHHFGTDGYPCKQIKTGFTLQLYIQKNQVRHFIVNNLYNLIKTGSAAQDFDLFFLDWVLIDQEHGPGDSMSLLQQIQAIGTRPCASITRIAWNEMPRFKQALDLGSAGIMIPHVETAEDAARAVSCMHYPPAGMRGVASSPRATGFATNFDTYLAQAIILPTAAACSLSGLPKRSTSHALAASASSGPV